MSQYFNGYYSKGQDIHFKMTTPAEETALFRKAKAGDEKSREFLIHNHLLFAAMEAQRLVQGKLPKDETISAANYAVMQAYERFNPELGFRFTTYLRPFIRGAVSQLWKSKFVGGQADSSISSSIVCKRAYDCKIGQGPREYTGRSMSETFMNRTRLTLDEETEQHPSEKIDLAKFNRAALGKALKTLSKRDAELIRWVYSENKSFAAIGRKRGTSREAVRATHARIIIRLKRLLKSEGVEA